MSKATESAFEQNSPMKEKKFVVWLKTKWNEKVPFKSLSETNFNVLTSTPWASVFLFGDEMSTLEMCTFIVKELKYKTVLDFHMTESYLKYN